MIEYLAQFGGLFALYMFLHFAVDFGVQTHTQGHGKSARNPKGNWHLFTHCLTYTVLMGAPLFVVLPPIEVVLAGGILFWSHTIGDTYFPVYLWFRFVRRPPLPRYTEEWSFAVAGKLVQENPGNGVILMVVDQVYHLAFLLPVIWMVMRHA